MSTLPASRSTPAQLAFSLAMVGLTAVLALMVWAVSGFEAGAVPVDALAGTGALFGCAGLVAAIWRQKWPLYTLAALTLACAAALVWAQLAGAPAAPALVSARPRELRADSNAFIAGLLTILALSLILSQSANRSLRLAALLFVRICIWVAGFWLLAHVVLQGDISQLFDNLPAASVQAMVAAALLFAAEMLMRGDRGWLNALAGSGDDAILARMILPLTLVPIAGGYFTMFGVRMARYRSDVGYLLDIEVTAVALLLMGAWAVRSVWRERQGRERLARTLELSPVIVRDAEGRIEYWPRGCEALYGWTAEEALGGLTNELLQTQFPTSREDAEIALARAGEWSGEVRQTTKEGATRWVAVRWIIQSDVGPNAESQVVESHTDITDLKLTHAALRDSEDYLAQAVATYEIGICSLDTRTNRAMFSPELERMVGVPRGGFGGSLERFTAMFVPEDREKSWRDATEEVQSRLPRHRHQVRVRRRDGEVRQLNGIRRYIYDDDGELVKVIGIYMDVTAQRNDQAELEARGERLLEMHSMLAHVSRLSAMGEMAAALAHELNQPLTAAGNSVGAIAMILGDPNKPIDDIARARVTRAAHHAQVQAVRAGEIVRRLREFVSRGEADTQAENLERLIDDAVALAVPSPASAKVEIRVLVDEEARVVLADRVQIEQVLVNLARNAVESMRDQDLPKVLTVKAGVMQDMAVVSVRDSGPGVADSVKDHLFSPFRSTKSEGMGMGLSICRRIVEAHGGKMWLETQQEPGAESGADFRFTLPLFKPEAEDVDA